jgi:integrase
VAGLRVGRLDLLRRSLTVCETAAQVGGFADVKTPASRRTLLVPPFLVDVLEHLATCGLTQADSESLVFVGVRGGRLHASNWNRRDWGPATRKAGIPGFHFHWLRHTSVALMVEVGTHPRVIQERLGHSSWATTMDTYGHILAATDDGVTDRLDSMFRTPNGTQLARPTMLTPRSGV